jgi:putative ABC transport system permease protein
VGEDCSSQMPPHDLVSSGAHGRPIRPWETAREQCIPGQPLARLDRLKQIMAADLLRDARYAVRTLVRSRGFAATAILTLTLGISGNAAIFTVVDTVLLRPLPYRAADRLVVLQESKPPQFATFSVAPGNFLDWQRRNTTFDGMAAFGRASMNLSGRGEPERLQAVRASAKLFPVLGTSPIVGRTFTAAEDSNGVPGVAVLAYALWQRRFGGDPRIVGQSVTLDGAPYTVIGVMPASFAFPSPEIELWVPIAFTSMEQQLHGGHYLAAIGRLKDRVTVEQGVQDLKAVARQLEREHPDSNKGWTILGTSFDRFAVQNVRTALLVLLGAVGLVLFIACANVANLVLVRGLGRRKELAIRAALGAGRWRLVRHMLAENVVVALLAGTLGLQAARWLVAALLTAAPTVLPRASEIDVNGRVLLFVLALSLVTPVFFGLAPALQLACTDLREMLASGGRQQARSAAHRTRCVLVVAEMALSIVLLAGASLLLRSFSRLVQVDPGFDSTNVVTAEIALPQARYARPEQAQRFYQALIERVSALPGVRAAAVTQSLFFLTDYVTDFIVDGRPAPPESERPNANLYGITPDFFRALGIRLIRGRLFEEQDQADAEPVAIINQTLAAQQFPNEDPIGGRLNASDPNGTWRRIVGIVTDTKEYGFGGPTTAQIYKPFAQSPFNGVYLVIKTNADLNGLAPSLRNAMAAIDPVQPFGQMRTLDDIEARSVRVQRFSAALIGIFAGVALLLAAIGLASVAAYSVTQRTYEIGVRKACGARDADVARMILKESFELAVPGIGIGIVTAFAAMRLMSSLLFGIHVADPVTFIIVPALLLIVTAMASVVPALRASRVDPLVALRSE